MEYIKHHLFVLVNQLTYKFSIRGKPAKLSQFMFIKKSDQIYQKKVSLHKKARLHRNVNRVTEVTIAYNYTQVVSLGVVCSCMMN